MELIDRNWLQSHLKDNRGEQARLARETGISPDKISKILKGARQVQANEAPLIWKFFYPDQPQTSPEEVKELLELWSRLSPEERDFLLKSAKGLLSPLDPSTHRSS
ncbi:hypothetical protein [Roseobacter sp. SK209-2-6]|uniref:hypothetical protein n=1 Tax=Roseobacter sp. SK209-2-6 TaxID=388739 RepID=UPI0012F51E51|nr:hypothetical protein [Roseobacter sp. SK209-2-6]